MHVLIIPSWYPMSANDISGSFFREQALALRESGCQVGVITPQLRKVKNFSEVILGRYGVMLEEDGGVHTLRMHGTNWFPRLKAIGARYWIEQGKKLYQEYEVSYGKPDIIHAHSTLYGGCLAYELSRVNGVPFVITEHSSAFARGSLTKRQEKMFLNAVIAADYRMAVSEKFKGLLEELSANASLSWNYVPNIVSSEFGRRPLMNRAGEHFTFINISILSGKKGVDNLIKAFSVLCQTNANAVLKIGGDGPERHALEGLVEKLSLRGRVIFLGKLTRSEVVREMECADSLVIASSYETFGVVAVEALALGKPVISTRCGGPESIVRQQDGVLVKVDDVNALSEAMIELLVNIKKYDPIEIRESCLARFGAAAVTKKLNKVYRQVICKKSDGLDF